MGRGTDDPATEADRQPSTIAHELAREIKRRRIAAGLSQRVLATRVGYSRQYVSMAEWEDANLPSPELVSAIDTALGAEGALIGLRGQIRTEKKHRRGSAALAPTDERICEPFGGESVDATDVLRRIHRLNRSVDPEVVHHLATSTLAIIENYEDADHAELVPALNRQRAWLNELVEDCAHPRQRASLFEVAGQTSGLLGYLAVGRGEFLLARAYCLEAFTLGDFSQNMVLRAWARGLQSFCEYYAGQYLDALRYAEDGFASGQPNSQTVRLMINGAARAMGKLNDAEGVERIVDAAFDVLARSDAPDGMPSSVSLGCYSPAQTAGNAATAYVSLGRPDKVAEYARLAMPEISRSGSPWSRSLVAIDMAHSHIGAEQGDPGYAADLVLGALDTSAGKPVVSVRKRAAEFVRDARRQWGALEKIAAVRDAVMALNSGAVLSNTEGQDG
ncbi:helix-turn-helix domain-containing protein [Nocardia jejuensis]|uniref:helix-turn-helix domain-containing protein n=1 Tax=Nocardia jejuensis TaxID=328049 RepID=UPI00082A9A0C|nr:helix-turn-helix transcriptional regulator [Nocardia jejuensis]